MAKVRTGNGVTGLYTAADSAARNTSTKMVNGLICEGGFVGKPVYRRELQAYKLVDEANQEHPFDNRAGAQIAAARMSNNGQKVVLFENVGGLRWEEVGVYEPNPLPVGTPLPEVVAPKPQRIRDARGGWRMETRGEMCKRLQASAAEPAAYTGMTDWDASHNPMEASARLWEQARQGKVQLYIRKGKGR